MLIKSNNINTKSSSITDRFLAKLAPNWLTPNHVSLLRLLLIPIIIAILALGYYLIGLVLFLIAAGLDSLDGAIARTRQHFSEWGLILDPLADKLLIMTVACFLLLLYPEKLLIIYVFVFELFMILISAFHIFQPNTKIKPSNIWGKSKMTTQVIGVTLAMLWLIWPTTPLLIISSLIIWLSLAFQITSIISYASKT